VLLDQVFSLFLSTERYVEDEAGDQKGTSQTGLGHNIHMMAISPSSVRALQKLSSLV